MNGTKETRQRMWMSGVPVMLKLPGQVQLSQRLPWLGMLMGAIGFPALVLFTMAWFAAPRVWLAGFATMSLAMVIALVCYILYMRSQPPILSYDIKSSLISIPRYEIILRENDLPRLRTHPATCRNGEGGEYQAIVLELAGSDAEQTQTLYVTDKIQRFRAAWGGFTEELASSSNANRNTRTHHHEHQGE